MVLKSQAAMATFHNWTLDTDLVVYGCMYTKPLRHHHHECRISTHSNYLVVMSVSSYPDWPTSCSQFQPGLGVIIVRASLNSNYSSPHKISDHQIHSTSFAWLTVIKKSTCTIITDKNSWSSSPASFLSSTSSMGFPLCRHPAKLIWWTIMNHGCSHPSIIQ